MSEAPYAVHLGAVHRVADIAVNMVGKINRNSSYRSASFAIGVNTKTSSGIRPSLRVNVLLRIAHIALPLKQLTQPR